MSTVAPIRSTGRPGTHPSGPAGRRPPPTSGRPGGADAGQPPQPTLRALAADVAQLYLEIECGRRPWTQARHVLEPRLAAQLEGVWVRPGTPGRLLAVTGSRTTADVYEAVAVVRRGPRVGAIAIRLVRRADRWLVAEAVRPEDGPLPEPPWPLQEDGADALDAFDLADDVDWAAARATADAADAGKGRPGGPAVVSLG